MSDLISDPPEPITPMKPNTLRLATRLRTCLAMNSEDGREDNLRCCCDDCVTTLAEDDGLRLVDPVKVRAAFKELDEASCALPIPHEWLTFDGVDRVQRFERAKHHVHVLLHEIAEP